jgi:hypothetical protein
MAILSDTSTVSDDDGDWIHSDYSYDDDDEDEVQREPELGVGVVGPSRRNGGFPPRVRWLRRKHLLHLLMMRRMEAAMKCAAHWRHDDDHDGSGKVTAAMPAVQLRSSQIQDSPPRRSGKRKRIDTETETENDTDTDTASIVRSKSYNRSSNDNDDSGESTGKCQRLGSCHVEGPGLPDDPMSSRTPLVCRCVYPSSVTVHAPCLLLCAPLVCRSLPPRSGL